MQSHFSFRISENHSESHYPQTEKSGEPSQEWPPNKKTPRSHWPHLGSEKENRTSSHELQASLVSVNVRGHDSIIRDIAPYHNCLVWLKVLLLPHNQLLGNYFFHTGPVRFGSFFSFNRWNHHLTTTFYTYSGYLCVILKCLIWNSLTNIQKEKEIKKREKHFFTALDVYMLIFFYFTFFFFGHFPFTTHCGLWF